MVYMLTVADKSHSSTTGDALMATIPRTIGLNMKALVIVLGPEHTVIVKTIRIRTLVLN